jgi:tRNA A-37 threonylcarbamoyl transferase component Bud32
MTKKNIILITLFVIIVILTFFLGRVSNVVEIKPPDVSSYQRSIDSLKSLNQDFQDSMKWTKILIDSLSKKKDINKKKVKNGIGQIKSFTPTTRQRWHDSTMSANGLK